MRLKSTTEFPPGSFQYLQSQTGWSAIPGSFDSVVRQVIGHRIGNKAISQQYNLSTDYTLVSAEVDEFNAARCVASGWNGFVIEAPAPSFRPPTVFKKLSQNVVGGSKRIVAGVKAVALWLGDGLKPVSQELAEQRASVCVKCPLNKEGDFWQKIGAAAASQVRTQLEIKNDMALKTIYDAQLFSCQACDCWLPLKTFCEIDFITSYTSEWVWGKLDPGCWMLSETGRTQSTSQQNSQSVAREKQITPKGTASKVASG